MTEPQQPDMLGDVVGVKFSRVWAMPSPNTFSIPPIRELALRWLRGREVVIDCFAGSCELGTIRNDLNPDAPTGWHMDAPEFLRRLAADSVVADAALLDPPYSPRQMSEVYKSVGIARGMQGSQTGRLYKECKDALIPLLRPGAIVITCGWNSAGMGTGRGFVLREVLLVPCGGAHNDYIVTVEQDESSPQQNELKL